MAGYATLFHFINYFDMHIHTDIIRSHSPRSSGNLSLSLLCKQGSSWGVGARFEPRTCLTALLSELYAAPWMSYAGPEPELSCCMKSYTLHPNEPGHAFLCSFSTIPDTVLGILPAKWVMCTNTINDMRHAYTDRLKPEPDLFLSFSIDLLLARK